MPPCAVGRRSGVHRLGDQGRTRRSGRRTSPSPSSSRPAPSWTAAPGGAVPASAAAASSSTPPTATVVRRPARSASRPTSGEKRYMPATCTLMTRPMIRSVVPSGPPAWPMCTGVITITPTITEWETTTEVSPSRPPGEAQPRAPPPRWRRAAGRRRPVAAPPAGEQQRVGPQQRQDDAGATRANTTADTANAPPSGGRPSERPRSAPGPGEVGPEHRADRRRPDHQGQVAARGARGRARSAAA